jgi:flagellar hook-associated protein 2
LEDGDTAGAASAFIDALQANIDEKFGAGKLTVTNGLLGDDGIYTDPSKEGQIALSFASASVGSSFKVSSGAGDSIGISGSLSNYLDTEKTLEDLLGEDDLTEDGKYVIEIGDAKLEFSKDTTLKSVMSEINSNEDTGVKVNYSQINNQLTFTSRETGTAGSISIKEGTTAAKLFGATVSADGETDLQIEKLDEDGNTEMVNKVTSGEDAVFTVTVNGTTYENMTRSSNTVDIDGLNITLKGEFTTGENEDAVTFNVSSDADTIVDAIKSMVADYNTMASAIKTAYSTMPLQKSDGSSYEPLSDDDMADMSDTAIERYETNAKTGLLFGDSDLSSCYSALLSAISSSTAGSKVFAEIGIGTSYSDGMTTLTLNETKLREALESDPDKVRDAFTGSTGLMQGLSDAVDRYAGTTGATKGILIEKAGSTLAPTSIYSNTWQSAIDDLDDEIEKWQDKLSDKIDYYTTQFTNLETLISEMNSQSSMLSSLSGN